MRMSSQRKWQAGGSHDDNSQPASIVVVRMMVVGVSWMYVCMRVCVVRRKGSPHPPSAFLPIAEVMDSMGRSLNQGASMGHLASPSLPPAFQSIPSSSSSAVSMV